MRRRRLLVLLVGIPAAACLEGSPADTGDDTPSATRTDEPSPTEPFETIAVGDGETVDSPEHNRPHFVDVTNAADRMRDIAIRIARGDSESDVVLDRTVSFPARGEFRVRLLVPDRYRVTVSVPADDRSRSFEIPEDRFDCNSSGHKVTVPPEDPIEVSLWSTAVGCTSPTSTPRMTASSTPTTTTSEDRDRSLPPRRVGPPPLGLVRFQWCRPQDISPRLPALRSRPY